MAAREAGTTLEVCVLGPLQVVSGGHPVRIAGDRARGLIGLLARCPGFPVTTAEIVGQVWDLDPAEARRPSVRNAVQARVSALRRVLGPSVVRAVDGGYVLDVPPSAVDAARFETGLADARRLRLSASSAEAADAYLAALVRWRSHTAYADLRQVPVLAEEGERLDELRVQALQEALATQVEAGRYDTAATESLRATRRYPEVEEFWALRMLALYHQDRQADALAVYLEARHELKERFGLEPGTRLREVEALILRRDVSSNAGLKFLGPARIARPATSFLGREYDVASALHLLRGTRMLTFTGPGGVGKTRLAVEIAQALVDRCCPVVAHGVAVVDLVPYSPGDDLAGAVLDALSILSVPGGAVNPRRARPTRDVLRDALRERRVLLVLDNCEHVAEEAAELCAWLLDGTPATMIIATSRQPLDVPGETTCAVTPLAVPDSGDDPASLRDVPAVRLFADRATALRPGLRLDDSAVRTVARICRRLDGLPLALELAAVRTRVLGLETVERLLDDRFSLLDRGPRTSPERHRTLEAVVAWSYTMLGSTEQGALARLSVFRGSFTLEQVCRLWARLGDGEHDALSAVEALVIRSMVQAESPGTSSVRFRLLETVRAYADQRVDDMCRRRALARAHVDVYVEVATEHSRDLMGAGQALALHRLLREDGNLRAAMLSAIELRLGDEAQALVGALGYVSWMRGGRGPSWQLIVRAMALPADDIDTRIRALAWATHLGSVLGHPAEAVAYGDQASELGRAGVRTARAELVFAVLARAHALHRLGRWAEGDAVLDDARRLAVSVGERWPLAGCAMVRGLGALARGRLADAEGQFVIADEHYQRCDDNWGRQRAALRRAMTREARGDYAGAAVLLEEAASFVAALELPEIAAPAKVALARATLLAGDVGAARAMVDELTRSGEVVWLEEPAAQLEQCEAILSELDGVREDAVRRHLRAAGRLANAGMLAEAVESWARAALLADPAADDRGMALAAADRAAAESADPRVLTTVLHMRGMTPGFRAAAAAAAEAAALRDQYGLAVPVLLSAGPIRLGRD